MIRRPPRSTQSRSSAASDVYKRQVSGGVLETASIVAIGLTPYINASIIFQLLGTVIPVSYTHLRAHETVLDLVCRLLLEKKKTSH